MGNLNSSSFRSPRFKSPTTLSALVLFYLVLSIVSMGSPNPQVLTTRIKIDLYQSTTPGDLEVSSLQYLSSQQALADLANFILSMKDQYEVPNATVIVFGCSYSGALASWFARILLLFTISFQYYVSQVPHEVPAHCSWCGCWFCARARCDRLLPVPRRGRPVAELLHWLTMRRHHPERNRPDPSHDQPAKYAILAA